MSRYKLFEQLLSKQNQIDDKLSRKLFYLEDSFPFLMKFHASLVARSKLIYSSDAHRLTSLKVGHYEMHVRMTVAS